MCDISTCNARSVERRSRSFPSCPHPIVRFIVRIATRRDVPRDKGDRAEVDAGTESAIDSLVSRSTLSACSFLFWVVAGIPGDRDACGKHLLWWSGHHYDVIQPLVLVIAGKSGKMMERGKAVDARGKRQDTDSRSRLQPC